jgi:hypothetical protein
MVYFFVTFVLWFVFCWTYLLIDYAPTISLVLFVTSTAYFMYLLHDALGERPMLFRIIYGVPIVASILLVYFGDFAKNLGSFFAMVVMLSILFLVPWAYLLTFKIQVTSIIRLMFGQYLKVVKGTGRFHRYYLRHSFTGFYVAPSKGTFSVYCGSLEEAISFSDPERAFNYGILVGIPILPYQE